MKEYSKSELKTIFNLAEKSLFKTSPLKKNELEANFKHYKQLHKKSKSFEEIYWLIVCVTFYSGFKTATVDDKLVAIKKVLGNYKKVAQYKTNTVNMLLKNNKIIKHSQKIKACIHNAKQIILLAKEFKTFEDYKKSFGSLDDEQSLKKFIKDLRRRFKYLGNITVYHFLTDIGVNVLKPDRVLCRIFFRLGLTKSIKDLFGVIEQGRKFAIATGHPIRYIDIIFVYYGQLSFKPELDTKAEICTERKPDCDSCGLTAYCNYFKTKR